MTDYKINVIVDPSGAQSGARKVKGALDGIDKEAKQAQKEIGGIGKAAQGAGSLVKQLFVAATITAGIGVLRNFGQEMSTVAAITGATGNTLDSLRQKAKDLGATTRFSGTEAAQGMQFLARAGFDANEVMGSIEGTLQLAQAGALDLASAADIASNVLTGMGLAVEETGRVVDVLALTANSANTNVQQLGDAFKFVAPIAAGLGISVEEVAASIGTLSNAGLQGSTAGTGLRKTMTSLLNPTAQARGVFKELGLTVEQLNPQTMGLANVLQTLGDAGLTAGQAMIIAGDRGGPALQVLTSNTTGIRELTGELNGAAGTAQRMADVMDDNLNGSFIALTSAISGLVLELGDSGLTAALRLIVDAATLLVRALIPLSPVILGLATAIGVNLATVALPVAIAATRTWITSLIALPAAAAAGTVSITGMTGALRLMTVAIATSPLGFFGTALLGVVFALGLGTNALNTLYQGLLNVFNLITGIGNVVLQSLSSAFESIGINLSSTSIGIGLVTAGLVAMAPVLITVATTMLSRLLPALITTATTMGGVLLTSLTTVVNSFRGLALIMADPRILGLTAVIGALIIGVIALTGNTEKAIKVWKEFTGQMGDAAEETEDAVDAVEDMNKRVQEQKAIIRDSAKNTQAYNIAMAEVAQETGAAATQTQTLNTQLQTAAPLTQEVATNAEAGADGMKKLADSGKDAEGTFKDLVKVLGTMENTLEQLSSAWADMAGEIRKAATQAKSSGISSPGAVTPGQVQTNQNVIAQCCGDSDGPDDSHPGSSGTNNTGSSGGGGGGSSTSGQTFTSDRGGGFIGALGGLDIRNVADVAAEREKIETANLGVMASAETAARTAIAIADLEETINRQLAQGVITAAEAASKFSTGKALIDRGIADPDVVGQLQAAGDTIYSSIIQNALDASADTVDLITKQTVALIGPKFGGGRTPFADILDELGLADIEQSGNPFEFLSQFADPAADALSGLTDAAGSLGGGIGGFTSALNSNTQAILDNTDRYTLAEQNVSNQYRAGLALPTATQNTYGSGSSRFDQTDFGLQEGRGTNGGTNINGLTIYANDAAGGKAAAIAFQNEQSRINRRGQRRTG